jgi:hypothetical protein
MVGHTSSTPEVYDLHGILADWTNVIEPEIALCSRTDLGNVGTTNVPRASQETRRGQAHNAECPSSSVNQMIDNMPLEDWAVYALTIMTEDNARLRNDLMSKDREMPCVMIKGTFEIKTDITEP